MSENDQDPSGEQAAPSTNQAPPSDAPAEPGDGVTSDDSFSSDQVKLALRKVKDPELGLNIVDLGLVYEITVDPSQNIHVDMTLTSPGCPAGPQIMTDVERVLQALPGVGEVEINLGGRRNIKKKKIEPRVRAYMGL